MKRVLSTDIPNTISGERRKECKKTFIVDPTCVVFAIGPDSWLRDGREDIAVSASLVGSLILANDTDNRIDGPRVGEGHGNAARVPADKTAQVPGYDTAGNPVLWGALSSVQLTVMGTDTEPVYVISAAGRQTAKASEYLTGLLRRLRELYQRVYTALEREREECRANLASLLKRKNLQPAEQERLFELQAADETFKKRTLDQQALEDVQAEARKVRDPVLAELSDAHFLAIFRGVAGLKFGKPLVGRTYSAVFHLSVGYVPDLPSDYRSLERSKLANFQVPSPPSAEADNTRRLVREYVLNGVCADEVQALERVRQYVRPLMAVGAEQPPSAQYVMQLYRLDMLVPEAKKAVDEQADPRKMLALFEKLTKRLFREALEEVERGNLKVHLTCNEMSDDEQRAELANILNPPKRGRTDKPKLKTQSVVPVRSDRAPILAKLAALRSPMNSLSDDQRREAAAVAAWERFQAGDAAALRDYPHLASAVADAEAEVDSEDTPLQMALDFLDGWNGRDKIELQAFAERQPKEDGELMAWRARGKTHEAKRLVAKKLIEDAAAKMPKTVKPDERANWIREELEAK